MTSTSGSQSLQRFRERFLAGDAAEAAVALREAAGAGDPTGMAILGGELIAALRTPDEVAEGVDLLFRAAELDQPQALELAAALLAEGVVRAQDWTRALDFLQRSAELGDPRARSQLALLTGDRDAAARIGAGEAGPELFERARRAIDLDAWLATPTGNVVSQDPLIVVFEGFLTEPLCGWLIERARGRIKPARIHELESHGLKEDDSRTNGSTEFAPLLHDVVMAIIRARIARVARLPAEALEYLSVLHYRPGQAFTPHFDYFNPDLPGHAVEIETRGQRVATFLCYLNLDFDGGQTDFPRLGLQYRGGPGDGILFLNVDRGFQPDPRSQHAGLPTTRGDKWLLSQFLRNAPQPWP